MRVLCLLQRSLCVVGRLGSGKKIARDGRAAIFDFFSFYEVISGTQYGGES